MRESAMPLLTVYCAAYNQEAYIRRTLEGFVMQQTDFRSRYMCMMMPPPITPLILFGNLVKSIRS